MKRAGDVLSRKRRDELGQFFTPEHVAELMASMFGPLPISIRLLDAGAGRGALTHAFVRRLCEHPRGVRAVDAVLYELDPDVLDPLTETMRECERLCSTAGIRFAFSIREADFIEEISAGLRNDLFGTKTPEFDAVITNPPYRKIKSGSATRRALSAAGIETSNLYTGFIALIQRLLAPEGQLVGITPRSFCNGPYFRPFRERFLNQLAIERIHSFESRQAAFRDDRVLQENVIFRAVKGRKQSEEITISCSSGEPGSCITETIFPFSDIVQPHDSERLIHIPSAGTHSAAKKAMAGLTHTLDSLGVEVSTGRVVDFRLKAAIRMTPEPGTVPLLYPTHFNGGVVHWPKLEARKPNAILDNDDTRQWLVPSGVYLLTKRFTSKEERRRLVACLFDPDRVKSERVGFENHLNYFHARGRGLERSLAVGLFAFLNSTVVDQYFRRFSGHTQVNATDLRNLSYPSRETLQAMGSAIKSPNLSQAEIDLLVSEHLDANE